MVGSVAFEPTAQKPKQEAHNMSSLHYVGMDVHKKTISYCVKTRAGCFATATCSCARRRA